MHAALSKTALFVAPLVLGGCCYFAPCHPAGRIAGDVTDALSHQPIPDATVRLYGYTTRTARSGCFALGGADALPFEFQVSAPGYRPMVIKAVSGFFAASVALVPEAGTAASHAELREVSPERYEELRGRCASGEKSSR
jgi:hypothetical protein